MSSTSIGSTLASATIGRTDSTVSREPNGEQAVVAEHAAAAAGICMSSKKLRERIARLADRGRIEDDDLHVVGVDLARLLRIDRGVDLVEVVAVVLAIAVFPQDLDADRPLVVRRELLDALGERAPVRPLGEQLPHVGFGERDVVLLVAVGADPDLQREVERLADVDLLFLAGDFDEQQVAGFALRGDEVERPRCERLAVGADGDRRDVEVAGSGRRDGEGIDHAGAGRRVAVDVRDLRAPRGLAERFDAEAGDFGDRRRIEVGGVRNLDLQRDRHADVGLARRDAGPHVGGRGFERKADRGK